MLEVSPPFVDTIYRSIPPTTPPPCIDLRTWPAACGNLALYISNLHLHISLSASASLSLIVTILLTVYTTHRWFHPKRAEGDIRCRGYHAPSHFPETGLHFLSSPRDVFILISLHTYLSPFHSSLTLHHVSLRSQFRRLQILGPPIRPLSCYHQPRSCQD